MFDIEQERLKVSKMKSDVSNHMGQRLSEAYNERRILSDTLHELHAIKDQYEETIGMLSPIYLISNTNTSRNVCNFSDGQLISIMLKHVGGLTLLELNNIVLETFGPPHSYTSMRKRMIKMRDKELVFSRRESMHRIVWMVKGEE